MADIKQVIAVRTDLGMGKGKIAAQVGHACVMGAEHVRKSNPDWFGILSLPVGRIRGQLMENR